jgi:hypothetical protein
MAACDGRDVGHTSKCRKDLPVTTMKEAFRKADGLNVRYAEAGQDNGETVVLTCPWPESLFAFRKVWDRLAEDFHLLAIDLPGFGQSERRIELLSPTAMGEFLVRMVQEWNLGWVHFISSGVRAAANSAKARGLPSAPLSNRVRTAACSSGLCASSNSAADASSSRSSRNFCSPAASSGLS